MVSQSGWMTYALTHGKPTGAAQGRAILRSGAYSTVGGQGSRLALIVAGDHGSGRGASHNLPSERPASLQHEHDEPATSAAGGPRRALGCSYGGVGRSTSRPGLRISEAIGLRGATSSSMFRRRICRYAARKARRWPKSRHGARLIPLTPELAAALRAHRPRNAIDDAFVFPGRNGGASD